MGPGSSSMGQQGGMGQGSGMGREWRAKEGRRDRERMWHRGEMWPRGKDVGWGWIEMVNADTGITPGKNPRFHKKLNMGKAVLSGLRKPTPWAPTPHCHPPLNTA